MHAKENSDNVLSPEERLLRIIKRQSKTAKAGQNNPSQSQSASRTEIKSQAYSPAAAVDKEENISRKGRPAISFRKDTLSGLAALQRLNGWLFIFWSLLVIVIVFVSVRMAAITGPSKSSSQRAFIKKYSGLDKEKFQILPFSYYAEIISKRNLFKVPAQFQAQDKNMPVKTAPSELLKSYSLSGVITGENPQAIIEDSASKKTYFLNKGQYLGDFKIDDIIEGKVILELRGQRFELSL